MKLKAIPALAMGAVAIYTLETLNVAPSIAAESLVVQTEDGAIQGNVAVGVENFLDIPYAAPPVGELRWSPPQPPAHWSDMRPAREYGSYCPQLKTLDSANLVVNEDCLDVNIQRPIGTRPDAKLPVYVYIHGGGYVTGSGNKDGQDRIVRTNPVVGVTFNYRLGALGFLALPSLTGSGDFGFEDQQAALGWIKRNIAAFGGDPDYITIGGESAGGWSVCAHLVAPGSRGLFNKAIIQSGACDSKPAAQAESGGIEFAHKLGCADTASMVSCLREKPVADLLNAQAPYYLLTDGTPVLPTNPLSAVNAGDYARVPIIVGSTRDELRSFFQSSVGWTEAQYEDFIQKNFGSHADAVLKLYPWPANAADPAAVAYQVAAVGTDNGNLGAGAIEQGIGGCATAALAATFAKNVPVYAYEFSPRSGPGWYTIAGYQWGAGHATELPYLYPLHDGGIAASGFTPEESRIADAMARYWGAFVMQGEPKAAGLPAWPAYSSNQGVLNFGEGGKIEFMTGAAFQNEHNCGFWDHFANAPYPMK
ncbi:carboxylesterase/lipase family protein [Roseiarcus sp.]|uniref:carboxylesterase/lipase family protein n=1 Tax=Roseiarcus sp. TaxID=1969460 RepID=UPI003F9D3E24